MLDIGKTLKDEIARISKRDANSLLAAHINTMRDGVVSRVRCR